MINLYSVRPKGFNIGNDVIYIGLRHFMRQAFKENVNIISLPATSKYESHKKAGINSQTIYEVNQFGHGLIIGGGNLYENNELEVNPIALKALEKPMMIFSVSRGKVYNKSLNLVDRTDTMPDDTIIRLNKRADISLSRDIATYEYIKGLGCDNILGGCPTLFINEMPQHLVPLSNDVKTDALISVRTPSLISVPLFYQYQVREHIQKIINFLKEKGYSNIKILCHDHRDIPFASSFQDINYLYTEDVYTFLSYLKNTRLNITYRLHSFIPCLSLDIPAINITYDQRSLSMLQTLSINEWNINMVKGDVVTEVKKRVDSLGDLNTIKEELKRGKWIELKERMKNGCDNFAKLVYNKHN